MANIMQMFRVKNKVTRDAYDLSKKVCFTAQAGELLPIYSRYMMPGDVADIQVKWKTRTAPLNRAAFTRFREYYDWYFVPINLLWNKFNTWSTNMKDNNQVATSIKGTTQLTDQHPYFTTGQIETFINGHKVGSGNPVGSTFYRATRNQFGFERYKLMCKLLHYLNYGDFYEAGDVNNSIYNLELSPWRLLAYQKIYQDWYRNSQWESASPQTCNINYISGAEGDLQIPIGEYVLQEDTMFDLRYANWNKDLFMGVLPNSQFGDAASINLSGISNTSFGPTSSANIALFSSATTSDIPLTTQVFSGGPEGTNTLLRVNDPNSGSTFDLTLGPIQVNTLRNALNLSSTSNIQSAFTILALRQAEALQKWKEITESNSKDFPSQIDAHFGVRPSDAYSDRCKRLFGTDGTIEIQDVDNTNITENEDGSFNGADIAGKGLTFGSGEKRKFSTEVPGVLMCIYHVVPLLDYALGNVAMDNMKTMYTDYPIPEFDKTGMMQVPLAAFTNKSRDLRDTGTGDVDPGSGLIGYAPNYIDCKTDIDEVKGAFYNGGLQSWVAPINDSYLRLWFRKGVDTVPTIWQGIDYRFFKVSPTVTNSIFATDASGDVSSDKFWTNCYFDIKMVRPLDAQGLPY